MLEGVIEGHVDRAMLPIENTTAGFGLRVLRPAAAVQPLAGRRGDCRRAPLPARRGRCAARVAAAHPLASAGVVAVQRVPVDLPQCEGVSAANTALAAQHVRDLNDPTEAAIASEEAGVAFRPARPPARHRQPAGELHALRGGVGGAGGVRSAHCRQGLDGAVDAPRARRAGAVPQCDRRRRASTSPSSNRGRGRARRGSTCSTWTWRATSRLPRMQAALAGLAERTVFLKVLGCYPARELPR